MLRNYLTTALCTLRRNTSYAVINVVGLAFGLACGVLLTLFVRHEWTCDRFHEQADRIARVNRIAPEPSGDRRVHLGKGMRGQRPEDERLSKSASFLGRTAGADRRCAVAHTECAVTHSRTCLRAA